MGAGKTTGDISKAFTAGEAIATEGLLAKFGSDDNTVMLATAATDAIIGVFMHSAALGETVRVAYDGMPNVKAGGAITRGDLLTADASGKAVLANPASGTNNTIIGRAQKSGVLDDMVPAYLTHTSLQG